MARYDDRINKLLGEYVIGEGNRFVRDKKNKPKKSKGAPEQHMDEDEQEELQEKFQKANFTFTDYLKQMSKMKKMGSFSSLLRAQKETTVHLAFPCLLRALLQNRKPFRLNPYPDLSIQRRWIRQVG